MSCGRTSPTMTLMRPTCSKRLAGVLRNPPDSWRATHTVRRRPVLRLIAALALAVAGLGAGASLGHAATTTVAAARYDCDHTAASAQGAYRNSLRANASSVRVTAHVLRAPAPVVVITRAGVAAKAGDDTVSVFHGSLDDAARIRDGGLDPGRAPTWASRDRRAAQDAIDPTVRRRAGRDPGIIESRVPRNVFDELFAPAERGYGGFFPYRLGKSSEIVMRSPRQIEAFNRHRVR